MWIGFPNMDMYIQNAQKSQSVASSYKVELARFSTLLRIQDLAKCAWRVGDTPQKKSILGGGDTTHTFLMEGTIRVGSKNKLGGGDTAHTLLMGEQLGWGHRTTLKGNMLRNPLDTFQTYPDTFQTL